MRLGIEIGDWRWRLEMEIGGGDWRWRLEMEIGDGDLRWIPKSRLFNISKFMPYMLKILYNPEMAKNGCFWPKMAVFGQKLWKMTHQDRTNYFLIIPIAFPMTLLLNTSKYLLKIC